MNPWQIVRRGDIQRLTEIVQMNLKFRDWRFVSLEYFHAIVSTAGATGKPQLVLRS